MIQLFNAINKFIGNSLPGKPDSDPNTIYNKVYGDYSNIFNQKTFPEAENKFVEFNKAYSSGEYADVIARAQQTFKLNNPSGVFANGQNPGWQVDATRNDYWLPKHLSEVDRNYFGFPKQTPYTFSR